jgi:hypothetical protein
MTLEAENFHKSLESKFYHGYFNIEEEMKIEHKYTGEEFIIKEVVLKNKAGLEI